MDFGGNDREIAAISSARCSMVNVNSPDVDKRTMASRAKVSRVRLPFGHSSASSPISRLAFSNASAAS